MAIENACEPVQLFASVAVTVKLNVPFDARDRLVGSAPAVTAKVYGPVPPEAFTLSPLYALLNVPAGNDPPPVRVTVIVAQAVTVRFTVAVALPVKFAIV